MEGAIETLGDDVTFVQLRLLQEVARGHGNGELLGVTQLAKNLDLPVSTTSRMVAQLGDFEPDGKGFITQVKHPEDRRRVVLQPTKRAFELRMRHLSYVSEQISPLIEKLNGA